MKRPFGLPSALCGLVLALFLIAVSGCTSGGSSPAVSPSGKSGSTDTLYLATDLHYLAPSLHDDGKAFQDYIAGGDSKLLNYSDELVEAWIAQVLRDKPRAVVLSGDITNNGEKASHQTLAKKLQTIKDAGIGVYVVPGNHDILNPWARGFKDDKQLVTDYITPQEFKTLYAPFGYEGAAAQDASSLSYVAKLSDRLWLLMLDTCDYTYNVDNGAPETGGFLADSGELRQFLGQDDPAFGVQRDGDQLAEDEGLDHVAFVRIQIGGFQAFGEHVEIVLIGAFQRLMVQRGPEIDGAGSRRFGKRLPELRRDGAAAFPVNFVDVCGQENGHRPDERPPYPVAGPRRREAPIRSFR